MLGPSSAMKRLLPICFSLLAAVLTTVGLPLHLEAKGYSSGGGRSYSSSSSRSSSSGGSHSFSSGGSKSAGSSSSHTFSSGGSKSSGAAGGHTFSSGGSAPSHSSSGGGAGHGASPAPSASKSAAPSHSPAPEPGGGKTFSTGTGRSYSSGSTGTADSRRSYNSGKSYTAGSGLTFKPGSDTAPAPTAAPRAVRTQTDPSPTPFAFDAAAARARKEAASKQDFTRFKEPPASPPKTPDLPGGIRNEPATPIARSPDPAIPPVIAPSYQVRPPPLPVSGGGYPPTVYVPEQAVVVSRPFRARSVFAPYYSRPAVSYRDSYDSFFWWWLLDRTLEDRATWAYHHRYDMDPARYQTLVASDRQLESRVAELETQQVPRDPAYTPPDLDRDLMYSDHVVNHAYSNRSTPAGVLAFWVLGIPAALAVTGFFLWLIWFKRWQTTPT